MSELGPRTDEEWQQMYAQATTRGRHEAETEPRAVAACYNSKARTLIVELKSGASFTFPVRLVPALADRTDDELAAVTVFPNGGTLIWQDLDVFIGVPGLIMHVLGSEEWLKQIRSLFGAAGGHARSEAKAAASRANGRKGGRPKKPRSETEHAKGA